MRDQAPLLLVAAIAWAGDVGLASAGHLRPGLELHVRRRRVSSVWLARPGEVDQIARLLVEFRDHLGHSWPTEDSFVSSVQRLIARPDAEFWLASLGADSAPGGICQLRFRHSVWTAAEDCWLEDLYVRPDARRRGLARALVERALERARERGCRRVELDTSEDNHGAIRLYDSLGFSATSKGTSRGVFMGAHLDRATR